MIEIFEVCLYCRSILIFSSAGNKTSNLNMQATRLPYEKRIFSLLLNWKIIYTPNHWR